MTLEELLDIPELKLVVLQNRYGGGWVAGIEIEDHPVIQTVNDLNGELDWEMYGLHNDESWYPINWGKTVQQSIENLQAKIQHWTKDQGKNVGLALSIFRKIDQQPDYNVTANPKTLVELQEWVNRWDSGKEQDVEIIAVK